uniref:Uncharacterized protein n=1 Tax=Neogobius melanostomus TaxID=47308 RepID=A0A8C6WQR8_9GOBI
MWKYRQTLNDQCSEYCNDCSNVSGPVSTVINFFHLKHPDYFSISLTSMKDKCHHVTWLLFLNYKMHELIGLHFQGYPVSIVTIDHVTPLHEACLSGHVACVRALINAGANVNATTIDGVTPLFNSCASGSSVCVELLLQNGANPRTTLAHHPSALHEACKRGSRECLESLLSRGVDPDYEVPHLGSALYISCFHKHSSCTKILLHKGANVNRGRGEDTNSNNLRPVELAPPGGKALQLLKAHNGRA